MSQEITAGDCINTSFFQAGCEGMAQVVEGQVLNLSLPTRGSETAFDVPDGMARLFVEEKIIARAALMKQRAAKLGLMSKTTKATKKKGGMK